MNNDLPEISNTKNQWLFGQIDVKFPTPESLAGRKLYQRALDSKNIEAFTPDRSEIALDEACLVDFHKMTVMFALNQSSAWKTEQDKANILEFFTQIILSDEHQLYIGLLNGEVVASGIVTISEQNVLISDLVSSCENVSINQVANQLVGFLNQDHDSGVKYWLEQ